MKSKIVLPIAKRFKTINFTKIEEILPSYIDKNYSAPQNPGHPTTI